MNAALQLPPGFDDRALAKAASLAAGAARDRMAGIASGPVPIKALDLMDFAAVEFPARTLIMDPWLSRADAAMVFGPRGLGKTNLSVALSVAIATGGSFGPWRATRPHKTVYLDGEMGGSSMQQRLLMHLGDTEPERDFFRIFNPDLLPRGVPLPDLATVEGQAAADEAIGDSEVAVIDNLSCWCRSGIENEGESWLSTQQWLSTLRRRGVSTILVHHAGKSGQQRGTSRREDALDVVIELRRPADYDARQGCRFEVIFSKARHLAGAQAQSLSMQMTTSLDGRASWTWSTLESSTFERVADLAREGLAPGEIAAELALHKSSVSRHLRAAREAGLLEDRA